MIINILTRREAPEAKGLAVVIDVFRAFSTACYMYDNGASAIIAVGDLEKAYELKKDHPEYLLIGERDGVIQPGFDFGNSPFYLQGHDFKGKTIVFTTSAGTQGIVNARSATEIITGSFVNAAAIVRYILQVNPSEVSLICSGSKDLEIVDEDVVCAKYIKNLLTNEPNDFDQTVEYLKNNFGRAFFNPEKTSHPEQDFNLCLKLDAFSFILKAEPAEGLIYLNKQEL